MDRSIGKSRRVSKRSRRKSHGKRAYLKDVETMSATELGRKYWRTYNCWRNMKHRVKRNGAIVSPEFDDFKNFLRIMEPCPGEGFTLDRIDNTDPEYAPGKVRWSNKTEQANNRSSTIMLTAKGITRPLTEWAEATNKKPDTLRRRHRERWTDYEVVYGRKKKVKGRMPSIEGRLDDVPWPGDAITAERMYRKQGKPNESRLDFYIRISEKEQAKLREIIDGIFERDEYEPCEQDVKIMENKIRSIEATIDRFQSDIMSYEHRKQEAKRIRDLPDTLHDIKEYSKYSEYYKK